MAAGYLPKDSAGTVIQGFEPTNVIAGAITSISLAGYTAFRPSADVSLKYTFGGVENTNTVNLLKGAITYCKNIDSILCTTAVNIEVM